MRTCMPAGAEQAMTWLFKGVMPPEAPGLQALMGVHGNEEAGRNNGRRGNNNNRRGRRQQQDRNGNGREGRVGGSALPGRTLCTVYRFAPLLYCFIDPACMHALHHGLVSVK